MNAPSRGICNIKQYKFALILNAISKHRCLQLDFLYDRKNAPLTHANFSAVLSSFAPCKTTSRSARVSSPASSSQEDYLTKDTHIITHTHTHSLCLNLPHKSRHFRVKTNWPLKIIDPFGKQGKTISISCYCNDVVTRLTHKNTHVAP